MKHIYACLCGTWVNLSVANATVDDGKPVNIWWKEEGNKLFDSLVKVGEELESKTVEVTDQTVNKVTEKTKESVAETKDKVEKLLDQRVNHSLTELV